VALSHPYSRPRRRSGRSPALPYPPRGQEEVYHGNLSQRPRRRQISVLPLTNPYHGCPQNSPPARTFPCQRSPASGGLARLGRACGVALRPPRHDSGSVWFATPSLYETSTRCALPAYPGASPYLSSSPCGRWVAFSFACSVIPPVVLFVLTKASPRSESNGILTS